MLDRMRYWLSIFHIILRLITTVLNTLWSHTPQPATATKPPALSKPRSQGLTLDFKDWIALLALVTSFSTLYLSQIYRSHRLTVTISSLDLYWEQQRQTILSNFMTINIVYENEGTSDEVIVSSQVKIGYVNYKSGEMLVEPPRPPQVLKAGDAVIDTLILPTSTVLRMLDMQPELPGPNGQPLPEYFKGMDKGKLEKVKHHSKATIYIQVDIVGRDGLVKELLPIFVAESDFTPDFSDMPQSPPHYQIYPLKKNFLLRKCKVCFLGEDYGPMYPNPMMPTL